MDEALAVHVPHCARDVHTKGADLVPVAGKSLLGDDIGKRPRPGVHNDTVGRLSQAFASQLVHEGFVGLTVVAAQNSNHKLVAESALLPHLDLAHELLAVPHQLERYGAITVVVVNT